VEAARSGSQKFPTSFDSFPSRKVLRFHYDQWLVARVNVVVRLLHTLLAQNTDTKNYVVSDHSSFKAIMFLLLRLLRSPRNIRTPYCKSREEAWVWLQVCRQ
jgi:hypothetical protein